MSKNYQPIISLNQVDITQNRKVILGNVSLSIDKGEFVYLIGKTGSGKTSLLRLLYADLPLNKGQANVNGFNLNQITRKEIPLLRRSMGIIFQDFKLLHDRTVEENLSFALKATGWTQKKAIKDRIDEVLALVELETKGFKMPYELSGGEQQRLGIARALLNEPDLILADEPTGNLDPDTSERVIEQLYALCKVKNVTVLMATHDYNLIQKLEGRVLRCLQGKLIDQPK